MAQPGGAWQAMRTLWNPLADLVPVAQANRTLAQEPAEALLSRMALALSSEYARLPVGPLKRFFSGEGLDFLHIREYQPGDDLRMLDWTVFARTGDPHVREYQDEHHLDVWFWVDLTAPMAFGREIPKWAYARQLAAALGTLAQQAGHRCGFILWTGSSQCAIQPPNRVSGPWVQGFMDCLEEANGLQQDPLDLPQPLQLPAPQTIAPGRSVWFLLSDFGFLDTLPQGEAWLHEVASRHTAHGIILSDPSEAKLPAGRGPLPLGQSSGPQAWPNLAKLSTRRNYQRKYAFAQVQRSQTVARILPSQMCSTQTPVLEAVRQIVLGGSTR